MVMDHLCEAVSPQWRYPPIRGRATEWLAELWDADPALSCRAICERLADERGLEIHETTLWYWLHGLIRGSFHPAEGFDALRAYLRQRERLVQYAASHIQHMQKALMLMNLQLHHVVADITGRTGMKILRAIVEGERDPLVLASMRDRRCKASLETIAAALEGNYRDEHLLSLKQALALYDTYNALAAECDTSIEAVLTRLRRIECGELAPVAVKRSRSRANEPTFDVRSAVAAVAGVDLTAIHGIGPTLALRLGAECGTDMTKWPTASAQPQSTCRSAQVSRHARSGGAGCFLATR